MRAVAPILAQIKDPTLRPEVTRDVAGWMGIDPGSLTAQVHQAASRPPGRDQPRREQPSADGRGEAGEGIPAEPTLPLPDRRDPVQVAERHLLQVALQYPLAVVPEDMDELAPEALRAAMHRAIWHAMREAGGVRAAAELSARAWVEAVLRATPPAVHPLVHELAVETLPDRLDAESGMPRDAFVDALVLRVRLAGLEQQIAQEVSALSRAEPGSAQERAVGERLNGLHRERARLRARTE